MRRVLFVASVGDEGVNVTGGQVTACRRFLGQNWRQCRISTFDTYDGGRANSFVSKSMRSFARTWGLSKAIGETKPDVVLIYSDLSTSAGCEKILMTLLCRLRGVGIVLSPRCEIAATSGMKRIVIRMLLRVSHCLAAQSEHARTSLLDLYAYRKGIFVARNFAPEWSAASTERDERAFRRPIEFVYVGRLDSLKGIDLLLESLGSLSRVSEWRMTIVGDGPDMDKLQGIAQSLIASGNVRFTGWIDHAEVDAILAKSDVFVFPSLTEGCPNSIVEAMTRGLPVVASKMSAIPEMVGEGVGGILFERGSVEGLTSALRFFLDHRAAIPDMRVAALERAKLLFSPGIIVDAYEAAFQCAAQAAGRN